ncbi:MAG: TetR/AcrR family transcriptional regulator [Hyphomicrobiaceae bacterium]|nr:TetR/AcrR family transcriptional regulator [Hyphomicrobiaceae bacterium]
MTRASTRKPRRAPMSSAAPAAAVADTATRGPGRPRSAETHQAILDAAVSLIGAKDYRDVTIDAIALEARVGKQSIYRWWPTKADLVLEAFTEHSLSRMPPLVPSADAFADLEADLRRFYAFMRNDLVARGVRSLIAEAQLDSDFRAKLYDNVHRVRCTALRRVLRHGYELGQFRDDLDEDALAHVIHGAFWYRFLAGTRFPADDVYARSVVALLRPALARDEQRQGGVAERKSAGRAAKSSRTKAGEKMRAARGARSVKAAGR